MLMVFPTIKNLERVAALRHRRRAAGVGAPPRGRARRAAVVEGQGGVGCRIVIDDDDLTVAVTGPTGEHRPRVPARAATPPHVARVIGMARRPFDPASLGLAKTEYRQGDVLDRDAVDALAADADVLVHLAFIIMGGREETREDEPRGLAQRVRRGAAVKRLVYTSSVAAYGFHADNPQPLTEDVPRAGQRGVLLLGPEGRARVAL